MPHTVNLKKAVGWNVRSIRQNRKLSQEELSARCGIFRTYLSRIEGGEANPSLLVLVALAESLQVGPQELLRK